MSIATPYPVVTTVCWTVTALDAVNSLTQFAANPVVFSISALSGVVLGVLLNKEFDFERVTYYLAGTRIESDRHLYSAAFSSGVGFLPFLFSKVSTYAVKFFLSAHVAGFRTGFMTVHAFCHIKFTLDTMSKLHAEKQPAEFEYVN